MRASRKAGKRQQGQGESLVQGEIVFDSPPPDLSVATIHVRLEDTSLADAPSQVVAEKELADLPGRPAKGEGIPFTLSGKRLDPRASYSVSVHVDLHSTGRIEPGDYINVESYPVLTYGHPRRVKVRVRPVKG